MKAYAAFYDNEIRLSSSSGGLFSLLASNFDVVYGVAMTDDCYGAEFYRVEDDISKLRGSKYIQARVGDTFNRVKKDLADGKKVLFSGTGCQINGLSMFLGRECNNLFLLDVVCHGVPSSMLWKNYVEYQEKKHGKLESVNFRCKDNNWTDFGMEENNLYIPKDKDPYMIFFLKNLSLRPSCYECHAKYYKKADMTIADFWGIESIAPELNDGKGTSLVITRTEKAQELFDLLKDNLKWKEVSYEDGVKYNTPEYKSVIKPKRRDDFYKDVNSMCFSKLVNKYVYGPLWKKIGRKLKNAIKANIFPAAVNVWGGYKKEN